MFARACLFVSALLLGLGASTWADDAPDPKGKPTYKPGAGKYAVWYDDAGWHFRATASKDGQVFTGKIATVDGGFSQMKTYSTMAGGKSNEPAPKWMDIKSKEFNVKFTLKKGSESGFDLKLNGEATGIKFLDLQIDGQAATKSILIGSKGANPAEETFEFPAKPGKK
ncbi:MAG TPA: hypothetical protein VHR66_30795 [Gemmataceae bacterium]|jgi:hypothetical protein|nr:hypothetical protein [Gemmataceae bacterium]